MNLSVTQQKKDNSINSDKVTRVLNKKQKFLVPSVYHFYKEPPLIVRGEGCYLFDSNGRFYLDCYTGVGAMSLGHSHPKILSAVHEQIDKLQHTTTIYLTEPMFELAEVLADMAPGNLGRTFFCASGTEANETAMLMASIKTGREHFLSLEKGLHGRTKSAMSVTQIPMWRADPFLLDTCCVAPGYEDPNSLEFIEKELKTEKYAAIILEPIQGNGGILVPPNGYWKTLRDLCFETGTLLIADEVQTGINRTGSFYAVEQEDVVPDFITTAKALGNGFPIAACITNDEIAESNKRPLASTYGGSPVACQAALTVIECHRELNLGEKSQQSGAFLVECLTELKEQFDIISDIRGKGLMIGVEIRPENADSAAEVTDFILEEMKNEGFLLGKTGLDRNVLTLMPPLIIENSQLRMLCESLSTVLGNIQP